MSEHRIVPDWDEYFMGMATYASIRSKDRSTQVGCVIVDTENTVVATGYNGFPRGCYDEGADVYRNVFGQERVALEARVEARHERPAKYKWTEHAERNAIYAVARRGGPSLKACTIYVPWFPCVDCARAIIQAGITSMVAYKPDFDDPRWGEDFKIAVEMLTEASVAIRYMDRPVLEATAA